MGELKKLAAFIGHSELRKGPVTCLCFPITNSFLTAFPASNPAKWVLNHLKGSTLIIS